MQHRLQHLRVRTNELTFWQVRAMLDVDHWQFSAGPDASAAVLLAIGEPWPQREGVCRLVCPDITVPDDWPLADTVLDLDLGGEGLVRLRYPDGREEPFGLDPNHRQLPLLDRRFSVEAEVVARLPFGVPNRHARLERARLLLRDPAVDRLTRLLQLVVETCATLDTHDVVPLMLTRAEDALAALPWPTATNTYNARIAPSEQQQSIWRLPSDLDPSPPGLTDDERELVNAVTDRLEQDIAALAARYPPDGLLALTGQAHLDLAWLWPMDETRRKARRTYSSMLALIERYPEMIFQGTSAQVYAFLEEDDPALLARIRDCAREGRWDLVGGMWVEPDMNMTSGESICRQLLYGQRYFDKMTGRRHRICYLPDCFGFTPATPQLLRLAGMDSFFTIKLTWSETNRFPYDLFWWEGLDGSRVLAHMFENPGTEEMGTGNYCASTQPFEIYRTWQNFRGKGVIDESLLSVGFGDGGGGTTAEMLETARALDRFPVLPRLRFSRVQDYFDRLHTRAARAVLPLWVGELYLELHRGTLTTQGRTKWLHRRAERDLIAAEVVGSLAALACEPLPASIEPLWRMLLRNQFHDILPGSSIREVYEQTERELSEVIAATQSIMTEMLATLQRKIAPAGEQPALLALNPDLSARPLRVEIPAPVLGAQPVDGGYVLSAATDVPPLGARVLLQARPVAGLEIDERRLENAFVRVDLGEDGAIARIVHKASGREALAGPGNMLWAYVDKPRSWDAWDVDSQYPRSGQQIGPPESIRVVEQGPHRAALRLTYSFRDSRIVQDIRLWSNSARIDFHTRLDWHDRRWLLKARFPLAIRANQALFETAFGVVDRPTHRNTTWDAARFEVAGHRFAVLQEPGFGVALLNDGRYGHHVVGSELGLSLLRSPIYPDPLADEGEQTLTYALYPFAGDWLAGGVLMEAEDLNRPLLTHAATAGDETTWQPLRIDGRALGLGALKSREDGDGLILRTYEPQGARGPVIVTLPEGWQLEAETNLLEDPIGSPELRFIPFQVHSWLLSKR